MSGPSSRAARSCPSTKALGAVGRSAVPPELLGEASRPGCVPWRGHQGTAWHSHSQLKERLQHGLPGKVCFSSPSDEVPRKVELLIIFLKGTGLPTLFYCFCLCVSGVELKVFTLGGARSPSSCLFFILSLDFLSHPAGLRL